MRIEPKKVLFIDHNGNRSVTAGEFIDTVDRLVYTLKRKEIPKDGCIAIRLSRGMEHIAAFLASAYIGLPYVTINPDYPQTRVDDIFESCKPSVIIDEEFLIEARSRKKVAHAVPTDISDDEPGVIYYTSGSTGKPKGVLNSRMVFVRTLWLSQCTGCKAEVGRYLSLTDYMFALSLIDWIHPLNHWLEMHIIDGSIKRDIDQLRSYINDRGIDASTMNPNLLRTIGPGTSLRDVNIAGEKPGIFKGFEGTRIINDYGATECYSISYNIITDYEKESHIGIPFKGEELFLDRGDFEEGDGEICLRCHQQMIRYMDRKDTGGIYTGTGPMKIYHTGDHGRLVNGNIINLGRLDGVVKINGQRVDSAEVEFTISKIEGVRNAVVKAFENSGTQYLCAYFESSDIGESEIRAEISRRLPEYMMPAFIKKYDALPRNERGKVDRASLQTLMPSTASGKAPRNDVERMICDAFSEVLEVKNIGIDDDFLAFGGDSLKAMKVQSLLKGKISSSDILLRRTPEKIAESARIFDSASDYDLSKKIPFNNGQTNIYLDEMRNDKGLAYNNPFRLKLRKDIDISKLKTALVKLQDVHPILKARVSDNGDPGLIIGNPIEIEETGTYDGFVHRFDLNGGPLCRFAICGNELFMDIHHLIIDGVSFKIIMEHITGLYEGKELPIDYGFIESSEYDRNVDFTDNKLFFDRMYADIEYDVGLMDSGDGTPEASFRKLNADVKSIEQFCRKTGITKGSMLTAAFAYALSRYSGQRYANFCIASAGRDRLDISESLGMFVRTVPIAVDCSDCRITDYLSKADAVLKGAMANSMVPFVELHRLYHVLPEIGFQYAFNIYDHSDTIFEDAVRTDFMPVSDINIGAFDDRDGISLRVESSGRYSPSMIDGLISVFESVLSEMMLKESMHDIAFFTDMSKNKSLTGPEHENSDPSVPDMFFNTARSHPERTFAKCEDKSITYAEALTRTENVMSLLSSAGLKEGDRVGVLVPRSIDYPICTLAAMALGLTYIPMDDEYPKERLQIMVDDPSAKAVLVTKDTSDLVDHKCKIDINTASSAKFSRSIYDPDRPAVILYSSGTTGIPKGSLIAGRSISNLCRWYVDTTGMNENDVFGMYPSFAFDVHILSLYSPIVSGGTLDVIPREIRLDMSALNDYFVKHDVTHTAMTAQVTKLFAKNVSETSVKVISTGGEKLGDLEHSPSYRIFDQYGPSEYTVCTTAMDIDRKSCADSVGSPVYNSTVYILDNEKRPVPEGAVGYIWVSGPQLTLGYINRDDLNKEVFAANPFSSEKYHERMYRTGDLGRILPDGTLGFAGRNDEQVKIRGNRVEPSEVEVIIRDMPGISDVSVQAKNVNGSNELIAYVVSDNDPVSIQEYVASRRPSYMIPAFVMKLDSIPLTVNGKVDRRRLPVPDSSMLRAEYHAPRNETERMLCNAMSEVLSIENVGIDDDFIRLGGDSIKAIKLLAKTGRIISTAELLELRTPRAIAEHTHGMESFSVKYTEESGCPLTDQQLSIYLEEKAHGKERAYLMDFSVFLENATLEKAKEALAETIEAHPILKTHVCEKDESQWLAVDSYPAMMDSIPSDIKFDLDSGPLAAFSMKEENGGCKVEGVIHHMIFDGHSISILADDLRSAAKGKKLRLDTGFLTETAYLEAMASSERFDEAREYYAMMLEEADTDPGLMFEDWNDCDSVGSIRSSADRHKVEKFAAEIGVTPNAVLNAAFAYTLSRFSGRVDSYYCIVDNGRDIAGESVGMFVKTIPLMIDCSDRIAKEFVKDVSKRVNGCVSRGFYPFTALANDYNANARVIFQYTSGYVDRSTSESIEFGLRPAGRDHISEFAMIVTDDRDGYVFVCDAEKKYSPNTIERFCGCFDRVLMGLTEKDLLSDIEYISDSDAELLDSFNDTHRGLPRIGVLEMLKNWTSKTPDKVFLTYLDRKYTFAETSRIVSSIASALSDNGIRKGDRVAVLAERSEWYMLCALGVLTSGAAYVPIDTSHPDERVSFIIADSGSKAVISTSETHSRASELSNGLPVIDVSSVKDAESAKIQHSPSDDFIVLYTSGTTGTPKGSLIPYKAVTNLIQWYSSDKGMTDSSIFSLYASCAFDAHLLMFSPLVSGGSLDIVPEDIRLDIYELNEHFVSHGVTHTDMTTQVAKMFAETIEKTTVQCISAGGEKMGSVTGTAVKLYDGYGPSENTVCLSSILASEKIDPSSVGPAIWNNKVYILDREKRRVPFGAVGELYVSGYQLSKGYLNREELTAKTFTVNPFSSERGFRRMYATGDFFRMLPDGTLGVIGRRDGQVKIRGNRVELTEVEAVINEIDCVTTAVVRPIVNSSNGKELCAYIVSERQMEADEVRTYVAERKPSYMVPSYYVFLEHLPMTINGKIDSKKLPMPDLTVQCEYRAPENPVQKRLCEVFASVLSLERFGIDDDFISMGGDSIKAIRVVSKCRTAGMNVAVGDVIGLRTVRKISQTVGEVEGNYESVEGPCLSTPAQKMFVRNIRNKNRFNQCMLLRASERIDAEAMQKAIDAVTDHHDMLRAVFDNGLNIRPAGKSVCTVRKSSFSEKSEAERFMDDVNGSLDIGSKLMACEIISMPDHDLLFLCIHHLVIDGVSWSVLLDDLTGAYTSVKNEKKITLPPKTMSFRDWTQLISDYTGEIPDKYREYWNKTVTEGDSEKENLIGSNEKFSSDLIVDENCFRNNPFRAGMDEIMLTALKLAYTRTYGGKKLFVMMEGHGRDQRLGDTGRTVGWFTCLYPITLSENCEDLSDEIWTAEMTCRNRPGEGVEYGLLAESGKMNSSVPIIAFNYLGDAFDYSSNGFESDGSYNTGDPLDPDDVLFGSMTVNVYSDSDGMHIAGACNTSSSLYKKRARFIREFERQLEDISDLCDDIRESNTYESPISEAQVSVFLDEIKNERGTAYNAPSSFRMPDGCDPIRVKAAVLSMIEAHPILKARLTQRHSIPWIVCDAKPEVVLVKGDFNVKGFMRPFELHTSLSRFWILDENGKITVYSNVHHIIYDITSSAVMQNDILKAYDGGKLSLDLGFIDTSDRDMRAQNSTKMIEAERFFDGMLSDVDPDSQPYPDVGTNTTNTTVSKITVPHANIEKLTKELGITENALFTAAFSYTISRFTGIEDTVFCFVENGRDTDALKNAVGMFAKIMPICIDCRNRPVADFLRSAGERIYGVMANDCFPFRTAVKKYGLNANVQFQYVKQKGTLKKDKRITQDQDFILTDIDFNVFDDDGNISAILITSDKYSKSTAERFVDTYARVLSGLVSCKELSEIQFVSENDIKIQESNNGPHVPLVHENMVDMFREAVSSYPDSVSVTYREKEYTYSDADGISSRISSYLMSKGIGKGDLVAVLVPRSEWYFLTPIGVIRSGAGYVPIDDSYPDERLLHMFNDSDCRCIIAKGDLVKRAKGMTDRTVYDLDEMLETKEILKDAEPTADDTIVILYTSGTTGKPKGSIITHRAVVNLAEWYSRYTGMTHDDRYGLYASIAFDMHTLALFMPLLHAASLDIVPEEYRLDMEKLNEHFVAKNVTHTFITTQVGKIFASLDMPSPIRYLMYGGEKLGKFTAPEHIGACESYGPSENIALSAAIYVNDRKDPSSVGYILPNIHAYILDKEKRRLPVGAVGELHLSGYQLSKGYLMRDELNKTVFIKNPFSDDDHHDRMYATGDFFRWLPDGTLGVIGRRDGQVKVRGNRVEITEVDDVIRTVPGVKNVTVQPIIDDKGAKELCAYVVPEEGRFLEADEIQSYVRARKPAFMVPAFVVFLDKIPLTVNSKIDKRALPKPDMTSLCSRYIPPRNEVERMLCELFERVLEMDTIGIDDNFIKLGGDSIRSIRLLSEIRSRGFENSQLTPTDVLSLCTPRALAEKLNASVEIPELYTFESGTPLTDAQRSVFDYIMQNKSKSYNLPFCISNDNWGNEYRLREAFIRLTDSCPIFRSRIVIRDGEPWMAYDAECDIPIYTKDPEIFKKEFVREFDILNEPLLRIAICKWGQKSTVFIDMHHMIFDGASIGPLMEKLKMLAAKEKLKVDSSIIRVASYDTLMKGSSRYAASKKLFDEMIDGASVDYIPDDSDGEMGISTREISVDGDKVRSYIKETQSSVTGFFSTVMALTYEEMTGKERCLFYLTEDGRGHLPIDHAIGLYAKGLPISISFKDRSIRDCVTETSAKLFRLMSFDEYSMWEAMSEKGIKWDIRFQYAHFYRKDGSMVEGYEYEPLNNILSPFCDIWAKVSESGSGYSLVIVHSDRYSDETIGRLADMYVENVRKIINGER